MSWDPSCRTITIKTLKKNEQGILEVVNKLNTKLTEKISINKEFKDNELTINLYENGWTKHGGFSNDNNYNLEKFIRDMLIIDKENTYIYQGHDSYLDVDRWIYYYEDDKFSRIPEKEYQFNLCKNKEQKIKKIKEDFSYFEKLSKEEQKDFDYQMASLEVDYGSDAYEYGSQWYDALYSDEFLDQEETVRAIFKFGYRFNLFKTRVKDIYKNDDKLMRECLKLRPGYISCLPFKFRDDKELVLSLIEIAKKQRNSRLSLCDVSKRLRNDKKVVLNFIKYNSYEFQYASDRLRNDYDLCKLFLELNDNFTSNLDIIKNKDILNDKEIILPIFKEKTVYHEYSLISDNLKNDKDILMAWLLHHYEIPR